MRSKKALWGFIVVLVLTLTLAGLTMYKIAEVFGLHQTQKAMNSFYQFVNKVNDTSARPVETKESMPLYMDEKSAILGFSRNSNEVFIKDMTWGDEQTSPRPGKCGSLDIACICLCRDYDWRMKVSSWHYYPTIEPLPTNVNPITCREEFICYNFTNFDLPTTMTNDDFGLNFKTNGGFIIAKNFMLGTVKIESRLTGIYITHETPDIVSISYNVEGISKETLQKQKERQEANKLAAEADAAFTNKQWDAAIQKYEEILSRNYYDYLNSGYQLKTYLYMAFAYYNKHDKENTLKAMDEALNHIEDDDVRKQIREKIAEAEKW